MRVVSNKLIGVGTSKMFHIYSDANGSLFRLWHRLWLVMLDVIFFQAEDGIRDSPE